jgi:hypothetical protein
MVENPHNPDHHSPRWWARVVGMGLALVAIGRGVLGQPASALPATSRTESAPPPEHNGQPPGGLEHPQVHFEHSDINHRWIIGIILGAMVFAGVVHYVILLFFYDYRNYEADIKRSHYPLSLPRSESLPPEPRLEQINRLEGTEVGNVYLRELSKESVLNTYGPIQGDDKHIHVPIEQAMAWLANKLPVRTRQPSLEQARRQNGLVDAGESNSGRMFRGANHD